MSILIDQLAGMSEDEALALDFEPKPRAKDYSWPAPVDTRGSVRLSNGRVVGRDEVAERWTTASRSVRKLLKR